MNIPPKYEDVVAKLDAALQRESLSDKHLGESLEREAALREELEEIKASVDGYDSPEHAAQVADTLGHANAALQQRLTVAERALGGMLFAFDDGVGREWSAPLLDFSRTITPAVEFVAALKPAAEPTIEVARQSLSFENQRIQPARFHCLACGEYHEGSGNLPCPKMKPMSGVKP